MTPAHATPIGDSRRRIPALTCRQCGGDNPVAAKFCRSCGAALGLTCAACGEPNAADSRFCVECGAGLQPVGRSASPASYTPRHLADRILATRSAIEGEIKQVTVLFCDLCDSTALAERLGAEEMHALLERFFERAMAAIHRYEGTVNQFLGDGFMALFGAPIALEDHARRALFAALDIRGAMTDPALLPGAEVRVRMGANTGPVVVGKIGDDLRTDYTAVGDVTNVAARLEQHASPGEIVASADTRRLAGDLLAYESIGPVTLKGKSTAVEAYRVVGAASRQSTARKADRARGPLVGRERERQTLVDLLERLESGQGMALGLVGEPGIGKSRIVAEARALIAERGMTCLESRCLPFTQSVPYSVVLDLVRGECGIDDFDTPEDISGKVRFALATFGLADEERVTAVLALLGVKDPGDRSAPAAVKRRAFDTLRALALRGSRLRPTVFLLEDLHWIDKGSEEFFAEVVGSVAAAPVMVLASYRPGYSPPWIGRSDAVQLALRALSADDSARIVAAASPALPAAAAAAVVSRAGGNPFFLEELARAVGVPGLAVPETVHGVIAARIDRLGGHAKRVLQIASVSGREFSAGLLDAIWDGPESIDDALRDLVRGEFIYERFGGDDTYVFSHALTHDVAYASMLERHRRSWHGAIGATIEREHGPTPPLELLAHHFGLSDDHDKAIDYAIRAGERAQRRWAHAEALGFLERALARLDTLPESAPNVRWRIDAVLKQSEARFALGQHAKHLSALDAIGGLVERAGDPPRRAAWHYWVGFLHSLTGSRPEIAIAHCERAASIAHEHGVEGIEAYARSCLAQVRLFTGELREGLAVGEAAVAAFESRGELWWASRTLGHLSPIANALGDWDRAAAYAQRALRHATTLDDQRLKIMALLRAASTVIQRGDAAEGLRLCDEATALEPAPFDMTTVRAMRGYGLVKAGQLSEGTASVTTSDLSG